MKSKVQLFCVTLVVTASIVLIYFIITAENDSAKIGTSATIADSNTNQEEETKIMSEKTYAFP